MKTMKSWYSMILFINTLCSFQRGRFSYVLLRTIRLLKLKASCDKRKKTIAVDKPTIPLGSYMEEFLRRIVKEAVAEALRENQPMEPIRYPERVTVAQASEITGYTKNSLYQMHSKGKIPGAQKVGGKLLFNTAALQKWVNEGGPQNVSETSPKDATQTLAPAYPVRCRK